MNSPSSATMLEPGNPETATSVLAPLLKANGFDLAFKLLNIGALPI